MTAYDKYGVIKYNNGKLYQLNELIAYVEDNRLNIETVSANGCSQFDPEIIEEEEEMPVMDYINNNWDSLINEFYNFKNK